MYSKFAQRCLSLLMALVMVLSLTPIQALATETEDTAPTEAEENVPTEASEPATEPEVNPAILRAQEEINVILTRYLGRTDLSYGEIEAIVSKMDWETIQTARYELSLLSEAECLLQLSEAELTDLCDKNPALFDFCDLLAQNAGDVSLFAANTTYTTYVQIGDNAQAIKVDYKSNKSSGGLDSQNGTTLVFSAVRQFLSGGTTTITIYNNTDNDATLSFDYSSTGSVASLKVDGTGSKSGSFSKLLAASASITVSLTGGSGLSGANPKVTLSNINLVAAAAASDITFEFDSSKGSVTVDGAAIASGDKKSLTLNPGGALVATPKSGVTFLGWIDTATNQVLSTAASFTLQPTNAMTVKAVFVTTASDTGWFLAGGGAYLFDDLTNANNYAKTAASKTIILANNGTLSGTHEISSGVTLLIPFDNAHTLYTTAPAPDENYTKPTAYRTLTMADGAVITVKNAGAVSVSGKHSAKMNSYNGSPSGPQGFIVMNEGSNITVEGNGTLYAWGYIVGEARSSNDTVPTGGTVTIESSGKVYECFQVTDYRGGSATSDMASAWGSNVKTYHVFPMSQYYVQNVQVPMTLHSNATETGYFSVNATGVGLRSVSVPFIGSTGMFRINSGYIVKDYDEQSDRLLIDIHGNLEMASIQLSIPGALGISIDIDSNDYVLPLTNNMTATLHTGYTLAITQDLAILPGAVLNVKENATVTVGTSSAKKSIYVYDTAQWGGYCGEYDQTIIPLAYAYDRLITRSADALTDAAVLINGTIDATNGYAYTTKDGANIYSTGAGKIIAGAAGTNTITYQVTQGQGNTSLTNVEIPITPAKLKHEDGTYLETSSATAATTYNHAHYTCPHDSTGTAATHGKWAAGEHTEVIDKAVAPAVGVTGKTEGSHCSACGEVIVVQQDLPALVGDVIYGTNIRAGDNLDLYFYINRSVVDNYSGLTAKVVSTKLDKTTNQPEFKEFPQKDWTEYSDEYYRICYENIAAKEMTEIITITVYDKDGNQFSVPVNESIRNYASRAFKTDNAELKTMMADMLNYGAAAQINFGHNTNDLANAQNTGENAVAGSALDETSISNDCKWLTEKPANCILDASVTLESSLVFNFYFKGLSSGNKAVATYTNHYGKVTHTFEATADLNGNLSLNVEGMAAADGSQIITCELFNGDTSIGKVQGSVEGYVYNVLNATAAENATDQEKTALTNLQALCRELMKFINSAYAYFH